MSRNDDYAKRNLLDYLYHHKIRTLLVSDQHINFTKKLGEDDGVTMLLLPKSSKKLF